MTLDEQRIRQMLATKKKWQRNTTSAYVFKNGEKIIHPELRQGLVCSLNSTFHNLGIKCEPTDVNYTRVMSIIKGLITIMFKAYRTGIESEQTQKTLRLFNIYWRQASMNFSYRIPPTNAVEKWEEKSFDDITLLHRAHYYSNPLSNKEAYTRAMEYWYTEMNTFLRSMRDKEVAPQFFQVIFSTFIGYLQNNFLRFFYNLCTAAEKGDISGIDPIWWFVSQMIAYNMGFYFMYDNGRKMTAMAQIKLISDGYMASCELCGIKSPCVFTTPYSFEGFHESPDQIVNLCDKCRGENMTGEGNEWCISCDCDCHNTITHKNNHSSVKERAGFWKYPLFPISGYYKWIDISVETSNNSYVTTEFKLKPISYLSPSVNTPSIYQSPVAQSQFNPLTQSQLNTVAFQPHDFHNIPPHIQAQKQSQITVSIPVTEDPDLSPVEIELLKKQHAFDF